ncbi:hypothetical protein PMAYCL1PPCAC_10999, partial [Pristionchus mayeri]
EMLSRGLRCASTVSSRSFAPTSCDPTAKYDFHPADEKDTGKIMDIALNHFIYTEPHAVALGMTRESAKDLVDYVVSKSLHYPFGYTIAHRESGKTVGFRLMSVEHKDESKDFEPFLLDFDKCGDAEQIFMTLTESMKDGVWKTHPEAKKVIRREITFVRRDHQRQGIAQHLLHLGLNFGKLKAEGYDGLRSEATSKANQTLLAKNGYTMLMENERKSYIRKDGRPISFPDD